MKVPGAAGLGDLDRMRDARPRGLSGSWRWCRSFLAAARSSRGVGIRSMTGTGRKGIGIKAINVKNDGLTDKRIYRRSAHLMGKVPVPAPSSSLFASFLSMAGTERGGSDNAGTAILCVESKRPPGA